MIGATLVDIGALVLVFSKTYSLLSVILSFSTTKLMHYATKGAQTRIDTFLCGQMNSEHLRECRIYFIFTHGQPLFKYIYVTSVCSIFFIYICVNSTKTTSRYKRTIMFAFHIFLAIFHEHA